MLDLQQHDFLIQYRKGTLNRVPDTQPRYTVLSSENDNTQTCAIKEEQLPSETTIFTDQPPPLGWYSELFRNVSINPSRYPSFLTKEQQLYQKSNRKRQFNDPTTEWKMCVPDELREQVLRECHNNPTAGHLGINKTLSRIFHRYFWPCWR